MQGLRRPCSDLSRGAVVDDIFNVAAVTALQSVSVEAQEESMSFMGIVTVAGVVGVAAVVVLVLNEVIRRAELE